MHIHVANKKDEEIWLRYLVTMSMYKGVCDELLPEAEPRKTVIGIFRLPSLMKR